MQNKGGVVGNSFSKLFIFFAMACSFCITFEYGIIRPTSNAYFVSIFGASMYPYVWIATIPLNFCVISLYNRFLPKVGCLSMFYAASLSVVGINLLAYSCIEKAPWIAFLHYIWKDIYILWMFKQLWSLVHSTIDTKKAKYIYGLLFGIGGFGSVMGASIPTAFAVSLGSRFLFLFSLPIYCMLLLAYRGALSTSKKVYGFQETFSPSMKNAFSLVMKTRFLTYILFLVVSMQVSVAFIEYNFNFYLEHTIASVDLRTEYCGYIMRLVNICTTSFQLLGGFLFIQFFGVKYVHRMIPMVLGCQVIYCFFYPSFASISSSFIAAKSIDHSVFGIAREMLYIPLSHEEKFRAKAVIDVFAYRSAKGIASVSLIGMQAIFQERFLGAMHYLSMMIFTMWLIATVLMFQKSSLPETAKPSLQ